LEHRWGRNVWAYELGSTGATLAARCLEFPQPFVITNETPFGPTARFWLPPTHTSDGTWVPLAFTKRTDTNFPYGFRVEPDAPV